MKRTFLTLLLFMIVSVGILFANGVEIGNLNYLLDETTHTAVVTYQNYSASYGWIYNYYDLTTADIPESVEYYGESYQVVGIGDEAFHGCNSLASVTIPETATSIGYMAFWYCTALGSVIIPSSVTSIAPSAFGNCTNLTSVYIPDRSAISIGEGAFSCCTALKVMWLPSCVSKIENHTFMGCTKLEQVNIPRETTEIGYEAFRDCNSLKKIYWEARNCAAYDFGTQMGEFVFVDSVEVIPNALCKGMEFYYRWIEIPSTVKVIGDSAFYGTNIMTLYLGNRLGEGAGEDKYSKLDSIGTDAFSHCTSLQTIECWATTPPALGEHVFDGITCSNVTLKVPYKSENAYRTADQWKEFYVETINPPSEYTIRFLNWDATLLQEVQTPAGEIPQYTGETPTREADEEYTYTFKGWKPKIIPAGGDATYVATFSSAPIEQGVENVVTDQSSYRKIIRDGQLFILLDDKTYTVTGAERK